MGLGPVLRARDGKRNGWTDAEEGPPRRANGRYRVFGTAVA